MVASLVGAVLIAAAPPAAPEVLLVVDRAVGRGVDVSAADVAVAVIAHELGERLGAAVVTWRDVELVFGGEPAAALAACEDGACYAEVAGALDVRHVIAGSVNAVGDELLIEARLLATPSAAPTLRVHRWLRSAAELGPAALELARELGAALTRAVRFRVAPWADVYVDGAEEPAAEHRMGPFELPLTFGLHRLRFDNAYAEPVELLIRVGTDSPPGDVLVRLQRRSEP